MLAFACYSLWRRYAVACRARRGLGIVLALAVPHLLSLRFGGVTGDVMGASVLLTETLLVRSGRAGLGC